MKLVVFFIMDKHSCHNYFDSVVYCGDVKTVDDFVKLKKFIKNMFKDKLSAGYNRIMIRDIINL